MILELPDAMPWSEGGHWLPPVRLSTCGRVRDIEVDERETPIGAATVRERLPATHSANAPSRGAPWARLCLKYGVRQDFLDWRALP
jgi:hypothetical protein